MQITATDKKNGIFLYIFFIKLFRKNFSSNRKEGLESLDFYKGFLLFYF